MSFFNFSEARQLSQTRHSKLPMRGKKAKQERRLLLIKTV